MPIYRATVRTQQNNEAIFVFVGADSVGDAERALEDRCMSDVDEITYVGERWSSLPRGAKMVITAKSMDGGRVPLMPRSVREFGLQVLVIASGLAGGLVLVVLILMVITWMMGGGVNFSFRFDA